MKHGIKASYLSASWAPSLYHNSAQGIEGLTPPHTLAGCLGTASLLGVLLSVVPPCLGAQEDAAHAAPEGLRADSTYTDVYVNDSFEAADALVRAQALADHGQWIEAAELLQRTIETAGDKLVRVSPGRYVGIREHVNDVIAGWPRVGIEAYDDLYERDVEAALTTLSTSRAVSDLLALFHQYFCTTGAAALADTLGQLAIESGDLALAEHVYRRVLEHHPDRALFAPRYHVMLTMISAMRGDRPIDQTDLDPEATVRWMGQERRLRDVIVEAGENFTSLRERTSADEWPVFGGNSERNRSASTRVDEFGLLWQSDAFTPRSGVGEGDQDDITFGGDRDRARNLSVFPVVDGELIVAQRFREIVAIHRNTGAAAWRFRADDFSSTSYAYLEEQPPPWDSPTIHEARVYAALPGETVPYYSYESPRSPPELVCLEAETGRTVWRIDPESIKDVFAEVLFDSAPIIRHGRMYVVGRRRRSFGFEDCYLYSFHAATGTPELRTHLGSASTGTFGSRQATKTITALHGDTVFVCTNLGSIAAVSAHTGTVRWLALYERRRQNTEDEGGWTGRQAKPWHFNPVTWSDGRLIVLPTDSGSLMVLSAEDGTLLQSIPVSSLGQMEAVLGVRGDTICGVGREATCFNLTTGEKLWSSPLPEGASLYGRGVWADDRLLVPTTLSLCTFDVSSGSRIDTRWHSEGEGGNLLALRDQVIVAEPDRICAYVRRTQIFESLRQRMAAAPADPMPALEMAEIALSNDEFEDAVNVLEEAVRRAQSQRAPPDPTIARRIFDDVLLFVTRLSARGELDDALLDKLYSHASRHAPDAVAHLAYRLRFAELFESRQQGPRAVRVYQQILRDRSLRRLPVRPDAPDSESADTLAQTRIAALIERHGRAIYAAYDAEAKQWLRSGQTAADAQVLERVVSTFPNSESAPLALVALGDLLASRGTPEPAAKRYAAAYHRYSEQVDRPTLLRKIADAYERSGKTEKAYLWLTKAAREHPGIRFEKNGHLVGFLEYRDRLSAVRHRVEPSRPTLVPPLTAHFTNQFEGTITLLVPRFGDEPLSSWARYYISQPSGIEGFDAKTGTRLWSDPAAVSGHVELLVSTSKVAVFATSTEVFALDATAGLRSWSYGEPPKHLERPDADWEDEPAYRAFAIRGDRLVAARSDGHLTCVAIDTGREIWSRTHRPIPTGSIHLSDAWVVYAVVQDGRVTLNLIDASNGSWVDTIATNERRSAEDVFVTLDGQIILVTSQSIASYEPESRQRRWRVSPGGHIRPTSLLLDLDAIHFSSDGRYLRKISLDDGRSLWESERHVRSTEDEWTVRRQDTSIGVSTTAFVAAIDAVTGLTLWKGASPRSPRFIARLLTQSYVVAVDVPDQFIDIDSTAYFYDHRHASGLIPRNGGAPNLGRLSDVRVVLAVDGALLIQTGSTVEGWAHK